VILRSSCPDKLTIYSALISRPSRPKTTENATLDEVGFSWSWLSEKLADSQPEYPHGWFVDVHFEIGRGFIKSVNKEILFLVDTSLLLDASDYRRVIMG